MDAKGVGDVISRKSRVAMMAGMRMNSRDMLWTIRLYFVGDATKANGPSATVAVCFGWIVVTSVAPDRVCITLVARWCV